MSREKDKHTTKGKTSNTLHFERRLGFWFPRGISRHTKPTGIYTGHGIKLFNARIQHLNETWTVALPATIRTSRRLAQEIDTLFDELAPELWPDLPNRDEAYWLIDAAPETISEKIRGDRTNNGLYTKNLFTSSPEDNKLLRHLFQGLVRSKIIQKRANNTAQRKAYQGKSSKVAHGDDDDDDDDDDDEDDDDNSHESDTAPARGSSVSTEPSVTPELIQFSEEDSVEELNMTAPPADMYRRVYNQLPPSRKLGATPDQQSGRNDQAISGPRSSAPFDNTPQGHEPRPKSTHKTAQATKGSPALSQKRGGDDLSGGPSSKKKSSDIARSLSSEITHRPHDITKATEAVGNHVPTNTTDTAASKATAPPAHVVSLATSSRGGSVQLSEVSGKQTNGTKVDHEDGPAAVFNNVRCFFSMADYGKEGMASIRLARVPNTDVLFRWVGAHIKHAPVNHALIIQVSAHQSQSLHSRHQLPDYMIPYILSGVDGQDTFQTFLMNLTERIRKGKTSSNLQLTITADRD